MRQTILILVLATLCGCGSGTGSREQEKVGGPLHHYQLARMYYEQGKLQEALKEVETSLKLDGNLPQVHFFLGYVHWNQEEWAPAVAAFQRSLEINPYNTEARQYLASALDKLGRSDEAIAQLDQALKDKQYPTPETILLNRAMVNRHLLRLEEALKDLRTAVGLNPRYYRGHFEMGGLLEELHRDGEALLAYQAAEAGYLQNAEFHYRYGACLFRLQRPRDAQKELQRSMELAPGSEVAAKAHELLGVIG